MNLGPDVCDPCISKTNLKMVLEKLRAVQGSS